MTIPPDTKPTEPSSLFSLSSLESLAVHTDLLVKDAPKKHEESSGMLDIQALAQATQQRRRADIESIAPTVPALLTPNLPRAYEEPAGWSTGTKAVVAAMGVSILALGGAVAFLAMRTPEAASSATPLAAVTEPATQAPIAPAPAVAAAAPAPAQGEPVAPTAALPEAPRTQAAVPVASEKHARASRSHSAQPGDTKSASAAAPVVAASSGTPQAGGSSSIDSLLDKALGSAPTSKPRPSAPPAASGATSPSRDEVLGEMKKVGARAKNCGAAPGSTAIAKVTVAGATGRVTNVEVQGQDDAKVRACIVHEVSRAKLTPFASASFSVTYPFRL